MKKELTDIYIYHGSNVIVQKPDLSHSFNGKDFGKGFYLTTSKEQALSFAKNKARRNNSMIGYINTYRLSSFDNLEITEFKNADINWLDCVVGNRDERFYFLSDKYNKSDVIIGKVADDQTSLVLSAYLTGAYGDVEKLSTKKEVIKRLLTNKLKDQICFKTTKSLKKIKFIEYEEVNL